MTLLEKLGITPGPWAVGENLNGKIAIMQDKTVGSAICIMTDGLFGGKKPELDARLIAQAPAMLEVLIEELTSMEFFGDEEFTLIKVRTIIESATGKTWGKIKELMEETNV